MPDTNKSLTDATSNRHLGLFSAFALVAASMIGSGVFTTSGFLIGDLGTPARVLAAWAGGGVLAMFGALSYGALARRFPESGGEYIFIAKTLHPAAGYVAGWVSFLVGFSAPCAAVAMAFGEYAKPWLPFSTPLVTGSVLLIIFALLHAFDIRTGASVQNVAVALKLVLIGGLIAFGASQVQPAPVETASAFPLAAFMTSLVWVSFSYSGWNAAVYMASEVRNPERNLPLALALGTGVVAIIYLGLNAVFVYATPPSAIAGKLEVGRIAAEAIGGRTLAEFVTALICLGLATSISSMIMAGPRVYARMADDGFLPGWFRFPKQGPPRESILLQTAAALIMLWTSTFQSLLTYIGLTLSLCTAAAVIGLIRLRLKEGRQLPVTGWPWIPGIFVISIAAIAVFLAVSKPLAIAASGVTIVTGFILWLVTTRRSTQP